MLCLSASFDSMFCPIIVHLPFIHSRNAAKYEKACRSAGEISSQLRQDVLRHWSLHFPIINFFVLFRWRRKGGKLLLSKYMLLFIVVLNIIDCTLVLGELILDLHHVKGIHFTAYLSEIKQSKIGFLIGCNFVGRGLNFLFHKRIIIIPDSVCP